MAKWTNRCPEISGIVDRVTEWVTSSVGHGHVTTTSYPIRIKRSAAQASRLRSATPCPRQTSSDPPRRVACTFITFSTLHGMSRSLQRQPDLYYSYSGSPKGTEVGGREGERERLPDINFLIFDRSCRLKWGSFLGT